MAIGGTFHLSGLWPPMSEAVRYLLKWAQYYQLQAQITEGFRSPAEQAALYRQGRTPYEIEHRIRKLGQGGAVTDAPPGESPHQYGLAVDVEGPDQRAVIALAQAIGFGTVTWDPAHIEWPGWRQLITRG
ncbi:MAG TPA: M15 family metallopeptidase [Gemmatimonadaceae bacterium]|nr:M15 family metallopeptidase [Gemmatimonadaceae bacterium]